MTITAAEFDVVLNAAGGFAGKQTVASLSTHAPCGVLRATAEPRRDPGGCQCRGRWTARSPLKFPVHFVAMSDVRSQEVACNVRRSWTASTLTLTAVWW
jgi:hypothetical protein